MIWFYFRKRDLLVLLLKSLLGLAIASSSACTFAHPLHADVTFTPEERDDLVRADAMIASHVGQDPVGIVFDAPHVDDVGGEGPCAEQTIIRHAEGGGGSHRAGCLRIGTADGRAYFYRLAAHELGHWYGLAHADDAPAIMNGKEIAPAWTAYDDVACGKRCAR